MRPADRLAVLLVRTLHVVAPVERLNIILHPVADISVRLPALAVLSQARFGIELDHIVARAERTVCHVHVALGIVDDLGVNAVDVFFRFAPEDGGLHQNSRLTVLIQYRMERTGFKRVRLIQQNARTRIAVTGSVRINDNTGMIPGAVHDAGIQPVTAAIRFCHDIGCPPACGIG